MTDFFYGLPLWLATILVLGVALAIGLGGSMGLRALFRIRATDEEKEVAINLMQVVAAYVGIMIAFAGVQVWQDFSEAQAAVSREANSAASLYQDFTVYGSDTLVARGALRAYVASVVEDEWPRLQDGKGSSITDAALINVFNEVGRLRPDDDQKSAIYDQALSRLHDLIDLRRDRIIESQNGIPIILWAIGLVGSLLTVSYASAFTPTRYNIMMIAGISITLGLVFLFILTVDYPYKGEFSISNRALRELPAEFAKLDQNAVTFPAPVRLRAASRR
jgi:hypothetical protein